MHIKVKKDSLLMKYIISSCIIFIIPTVILVASLYSSNIVQLQRQIEESGISRVNQVKDIMDLRFKELDMISIKISQDYSVSKFYMNSGLLEEMNGIANIAKYKELNSFVEDILVYFRNDEVIYSADGRSSFDTMFNLIYQYPSSVRYDIINNLNTLENPKILKSEEVLVRSTEKDNMVTYMYPISKNYEKKYLTIGFVISQRTIASMINDILGDEQGKTFIFDAQNNIVYSPDLSELTSYEGVSTAVSNVTEDGLSTKMINGEDYILISSTSANYGLRFISVIPKSQFLYDVVKSKISLSILIFVILLLGMIIIVLAVLNNYKGIKKIKNKMDFYSQDSNENIGEIDQIINWMDSAIESNAKIEDEYNLRGRIIREQLLEMLLKGEISSSGNIKSIIGNNDLGLVGTFLCVMAIACPKSSKKLDNVGQLSTLIHAVKHFESVQILELVLDNVAAIIISGESIDQVIQMYERITEVIKRIYQGNQINIGIGKVYDDLSYINNSFFEAQISLEHIVDKNINVLKYEDVIFEKDNEAYWNLNEEQARFIQCVKYGNLEDAKTNLDIMLDTINAKETSYIYRNLAYLDIINTLIKVCKSNKIDIDYEDIVELSNLSNFEHIQENIETVLEHICHKRQSNQGKQSNQIINNIMSYIDENFRKSDISLESVADHFGLSSYFLSRFFKEHADKNFTDYLVTLRMDEFKHILIETDKPIKDIIQEVGYFDISSFVRKFKKIEGVTPGAYRKMMNKS